MLSSGPLLDIAGQFLKRLPRTSLIVHRWNVLEFDSYDCSIVVGLKCDRHCHLSRESEIGRIKGNRFNDSF